MEPSTQPPQTQVQAQTLPKKDPEQVQNPSSGVDKKKIPWGGIIIIFILLLILVIVGSYFLMDESKLGQCEKTEDCGGYNVFYIKGDGYVCANIDIVERSSIKTKVLLLKYASKNAINREPTGCPCVANQCEVE